MGKTTQIARLAKHLEQQGSRVVVTREPGGTQVANRIRSLILDPKMNGLIPLAELFLYEASRAQHVKEIILPSLERGDVVICDRFADSSVVYQGAGRGLARKTVEVLNKLATGNLRPDLTIVLDLDPRIGLARVGTRGVLDRLEREKLGFHKRVRAGFLRLAKENPKRVHVISASKSRDEVHTLILEKIQRHR